MGFDPNEPRRADGQWTSFDASNALYKAASDKKDDVEKTKSLLKTIVDKPQEINIKEISVNKTEFNEAVSNIQRNQLSRSKNKPFDVTYNIETGEYKLFNGYHRLAEKLGGVFHTDEVLKNTDLNIKANIKLIKTVDNGRLTEDVQLSPEQVAESYYKAKQSDSNSKLIKAVEKLLKLK